MAAAHRGPARLRAVPEDGDRPRRLSHSARRPAAMDSMIKTAPDSPWHEGELAIQRHIGVADQMATVGRRTIRDHLTEQHRAFYPQLPFIVAGTVDAAGDAWVTVLSGRPGFLRAPD